uniref:30S ribosomal protein S16 n=1 Tax=Phaeomonas parva TaxID=124430 RepID=A0A7S1U1H1_9STRA|mmetsp:Transcript_24735/g.77557  ORF Transcript_24735/g.77557 Transcript_24735/m.77557 type:complete len:103 (+) Transcript_24735:80-388(+)|eukprot:CAMPEP_0118885030 /NCGR_PEP_ID=MMETSP1163-20130328/23663_1 /TAXON_ID=124430 /ORGANISM="Phaeomonas parva, Strain CCMP2877" /LENGTH=102 /DNA_ID=CAMNT_0006822955 /DNA_START=146 /DNA_END=454 /DNA_ORIENTATION=-
MVVRLRLQRFGRKALPFYRIVAANARTPRDGKCLEYLGNYNPVPHKITGEKEVQLNADRIRYWLAVGAQPSDRVAWLLAKAGIMPSRPSMLKTRKPKKEAED